MEAIRDLPFGVGNVESEEVQGKQTSKLFLAVLSLTVIPRKPQIKTIMFDDVDDDDDDNNKDGDGDEP